MTETHNGRLINHVARHDDILPHYDSETIAAIIMYLIGSCIVEKAKEEQSEVEDTFIFRCFVGFFVMTKYFKSPIEITNEMNGHLSLAEPD